MHRPDEKTLTGCAKKYADHAAKVYSGKPDWPSIQMAWECLRDAFRDAPCDLTARWNGFDDFLACHDAVHIRELRAEG